MPWRRSAEILLAIEFQEPILLTYYCRISHWILSRIPNSRLSGALVRVIQSKGVGKKQRVEVTFLKNLGQVCPIRQITSLGRWSIGRILPLAERKMAYGEHVKTIEVYPPFRRWRFSCHGARISFQVNNNDVFWMFLSIESRFNSKVSLTSMFMLILFILFGSCRPRSVRECCHLYLKARIILRSYQNWVDCDICDKMHFPWGNPSGTEECRITLSAVESRHSTSKVKLTGWTTLFRTSTPDVCLQVSL